MATHSSLSASSDSFNKAGSLLSVSFDFASATWDTTMRYQEGMKKLFEHHAAQINRDFISGESIPSNA
eukprot:scaffold1608_cov140-Skeletonema_dohrnii-CCMP3373.AAC.4